MSTATHPHTNARSSTHLDGDGHASQNPADRRDTAAVAHRRRTDRPPIGRFLLLFAGLLLAALSLAALSPDAAADNPAPAGQAAAPEA